MLSILSDTEKAVVETITKGLLPEPALSYLEGVGFKMSRATYFRHKKKIEDTKQERMKFIAEHFQELHLEKMDRLELIDKLMWENYEKEQQPSRKVKILESIANLLPYLTSFYESSTIAIQVSSKFNGNGDSRPLDDLMTFDEWYRKDYSNHVIPQIGNETDEENGRYYRDLEKKYSEYVDDWNYRNGFPSSKDTTESKAWTTESEVPKSLGHIEEKVVYDPPKEEQPKPIVDIREPISLKTEIQTEEDEYKVHDDIIDVDVLGRERKPFDVVEWIQCNLQDCKKWFKDKEIRNKHIVKYHT